MPVRHKATAREVGLRAGFRSGLEEAQAEALRLQGIPFEYEGFRIPFVPPAKLRHYTPDILLLSNGIVVELKGRFVTADRQKHKLVKAQHPDIEIRFVFSNSRTRISKQSMTTYGAWCGAHGFKYADKQIPAEWFREKPNTRSLAAIVDLKGARQ